MQNLRKGSGWKYFNWNVASENKNEWDKEEGKRKRLTVKGIPVEWRLDCVGSPEKHLDSLSSAAHMKNRSWNSYTLSPCPYCPLGIITALVISSPMAREWLGEKGKINVAFLLWGGEKNFQTQFQQGCVPHTNKPILPHTNKQFSGRQQGVWEFNSILILYKR